MPLKTSLYRKASSSRWPLRLSRRKETLSVNMISLPLADVRHLAHISSDGHSESFGDLSFLRRGHSLLLQSSQSEQNLFLACSPPPKPPRLNLEETLEEAQEVREWSAGRHLTDDRMNKSASLPLLDSEEGDELGPGRPNGSPSPRGGSLSSSRDADSTQTCAEEPESGGCDELDGPFSFHLDLGPSIMDEVLQVMERLRY